MINLTFSDSVLLAITEFKLQCMSNEDSGGDMRNGGRQADAHLSVKKFTIWDLFSARRNIDKC